MTVHLLKGNDAVLLDEAAGDLVRELVGERDRTQVLEEFRGTDYGMDAVVFAATTISMFGDRVVVVRDMGRFGTKEFGSDLDMLLSVVRHPPPDVEIVLVWDRPSTPGTRAVPVPKRLTEALGEGGGEVRDCAVPTGKAQKGWLAERLAASSVTLAPPARGLLESTLGEDVTRVGAVLERLEAAFAGTPGALSPDDVAPYLGDAGGVPPWDLTDAIDQGRVADAVDYARRMMAGGGRHPLQVLVTLQNHVERMLRLDGSDVVGEKEAAVLLGMKGSTFPAKKALSRSRELGSERLTRAAVLLAEADVAVRGGSAMPAEAVVELLVARLAALGSGVSRRTSRRR